MLTAWKIVLFVIRSLDSIELAFNFMYASVNQQQIKKASWR